MKQIAIASVALMGFSLLASGADLAGQPDFAIRATHILVEGDTVIKDGVVLVGDGKILAVGAQADLLEGQPSGLHVVEHEGWLSTGLVAANGSMGLSYTDDSTSAFMEKLLLTPGLDRDAKELAEALNLGITSFGLVAGRSNVIGGVGAVVKTDGSIVKQRAILSVCLAPPAVRGNRFPSSYGGALRSLQERVDAGVGPLANASKRKGDLSVQIAVNSRAEIARAIGFAKQAGFRMVLRGALRAGDFAEDLKAAGFSVALNPLTLGASPQATASMLALSKAGVPFAFGLADGGSAPALREGAILAVRAGLDRATAWRSLTSTAASLVGSGKQLGRVAPGFDADLVLWSGDPLSTTSRPVAVYLDGKLSKGGQQ